jgi:hypothetical protein
MIEFIAARCNLTRKITNLDRSGGAGDENVVAFEISVDNRRRSGVQKMKAFENLSAPAK